MPTPTSMQVCRTIGSLLTLVVILFSVHTSVAFAARNAGLIDGVWFSNERPTEDSVVTIYAGILNQTEQPIQGSITFLIDNATASSTSFSVSPDSIQRISVSSTLPAGQHAIAAKVQTISDGSVVQYYSLPPRPIFVDAKPAPTPAATTGSSGGGGIGIGGEVGTSAGAVTNLFTSIFGNGSTGTSTTATANNSGNVIASLSHTISSATSPFTKSLTTSRNMLIGVKSSATTTAPVVPSSFLDVITPTRNLFDVSVDIVGKSKHGLSWIDAAWAFLLSIFAWILYCIIPLLFLLLLFILWRYSQRRKYSRR